MKVTLITGASSGIGKAFARRLAQEGHNLVLVARTEKKLAAICDELMLEHDITAHYIAINLNDHKADKRVFHETENHGLEVSWLINNAGFGSMGEFSVLDLENELDMIGLNILSPVALTHRYLGQMRERKEGTIINVSSTAAFQPVPFMATYGATKAFVSSFSEALAEENRPHGIRVLALCPGTTETNFFAASNIREPFRAKGVQMAEDVVEAALAALRKNKSKVVSGRTNALLSTAATIVPNWIITRVIGRALRGKGDGQRNNTGDPDAP